MNTLIENFELYLNGSPAFALLAVFLGGLAASFTPCTYPMIPITVAIIGGKSIGSKKRLTGFLLSLIYVAGMATTYAVLGMIAALTGRFFGEINSSPWVFFIVGNILLILALIMMNVIPMPTFSSKIETGKMSGRGGVFLIGVASGLVAGPCTAPVLAIVLGYVATTKSVVFGGILLFVFAFGMGTVLLLAGSFSGFLTSMPKSGNWMNRFKVGISILMILAAEYFFVRMGQMLL